jgi:hypothetical protein
MKKTLTALFSLFLAVPAFSQERRKIKVSLHSLDTLILTICQTSIILEI